MNSRKYLFWPLVLILLISFACNTTYQVQLIAERTPLPFKYCRITLYDFSTSLSHTDKVFIGQIMEAIMTKKGYQVINGSDSSELNLILSFKYQLGYTDRTLYRMGRGGQPTYLPPQSYKIGIIEVTIEDRNGTFLILAKNEINYCPENKIPFSEYYSEVKGELKAMMLRFPNSKLKQ